MADLTEYFLATGSNDYERMHIINKLYNPYTLNFIENSGLKSGMTVLEIGCGTGHMAVELSKLVGNAGKVIASDLNDDQLAIAKSVAAKAGCTNIEFLKLDINHLVSGLDSQIDLIYGRWVIEFAKDTETTVKNLCQYLKPDGILVYEGVDVSDTEYFTYPYSATVDKWFKLILKNWQSNKMDIHFIKKLYYNMAKHGVPDLNIASNQIILTTPEEKSIIRLGLISVKDTYLKKNFLSQSEYENMLEDLKQVEESGSFIGYVRNILISAKCSKWSESINCMAQKIRTY